MQFVDYWGIRALLDPWLGPYPPFVSTIVIILGHLRPRRIPQLTVAGEVP
jgi:hypothetical protein